MSIEGFKARIGASGLDVLRACDLTVVHGANVGDTLGPPGAAEPGDIYSMCPGARTWHLDIEGSGEFRIAAGALVGRPGAILRPEARLTFMCPAGTVQEAVILVQDGADNARFLHPLGRLRPRTEYTLVAIETDRPFARATPRPLLASAMRVLMADGAQRPAGALTAGDMILTRDNGMRPVRRVERTTLRASASTAPVTFSPGSVGNAKKLTVSAAQRLYFHQRDDRAGAGGAEVVVRAEDLVNNTTILRDAGGFFDFVQILLDAPENIYAEGVAVEVPGLCDGPPDDQRRPNGRADPREVRTPPTRGLDLAEILTTASRL